ncbi:helix-turn-helix domain-containing protein [Kribbella catacumbae]|uniref:helix-turn-helix domain-containing protein n=1 Tax=Kribbella catacumbae TaxID=460086 RepID=UPI0003673E21|nr:helix-turn-helix domain-containing protein [Kribbella catacumbae]
MVVLNKRDTRELDWPRHQRHQFFRPSPDLAQFVVTYWHASWRYATPYRQLIVPLPQVNLSYRCGAVPEVHGVSRGHTFKELSGNDCAFGVTFRPGCFRRFLGAAVRSITDRSVPAAQVFADVPDQPEIPLIEAMLRRLLPAPDPSADLAAAIIDTIATEPGIQRVDLLARQFDLSVRQLERLFAEHVGVAPKWVIRRHRLQEAADRMKDTKPIDWAALADTLGYADQPHLTRDFTRMFSEPPTAYAARYGPAVN